MMRETSAPCSPHCPYFMTSQITSSLQTLHPFSAKFIWKCMGSSGSCLSCHPHSSHKQVEQLQLYKETASWNSSFSIENWQSSRSLFKATEGGGQKRKPFPKQLAKAWLPKVAVVPHLLEGSGQRVLKIAAFSVIGTTDWPQCCLGEGRHAAYENPQEAAKKLSGEI